MKYLIITPGYPSEDNLYNNAFVHSRVKNYQEKKLDISVFSVNSKKSETKYYYDGVNVIEGNYESLTKHLKEKKYDKILIHFAWKKTIKTILKVCPTTPLIIWVHGVEALGWYRRIFTFSIKKFYRFFGYIIVNTSQMYFMHNLIKNAKINKEFIFVSEWMKEILEKDSFSRGKIKKYHIIPNVIDDKIFKYIEKAPNQRLNIISIRPYASKKYANDITVKAILELKKEPFFNELTFNLYGDGKLFNKVTKPLEGINNVKLHKKFLNQKEISEIHKKNGIILIPTRQDAQGVSMCEAMMSGLVPITSNNTAIPEYVNNESGYLTNNYLEIAESVKELYENPNIFLKKSKEANKQMLSKCSPKEVIKKEIKLIEQSSEDKYEK